MKNLPALFFLIFLLVLSACAGDNAAYSRIYTEGKITGTNIDFKKIEVKIVDDNTVIAETFPNDSGYFELSGILISGSCALSLNKNIKSFSTSKPDCTVSTDLKKILIPNGITNITFTEIVLE